MNSVVASCPSSLWTDPDARVFGVVTGTVEEPAVEYLDATVEPSSKLLALLPEGVGPGEVYRVAAPCKQGACRNYDATAQSCDLVNRIVAQVPIDVTMLAFCAIRKSCQWFAQHGNAACKRCSIVTSRAVKTSPELAGSVGGSTK